MAEPSNLGRVEISPVAVASIVNQSLQQTYGVVGVSPKSRVDSLTLALAHDGHRGIEVRIKDDHIAIDLYVIIEYGTRISVVAQSLMKQVRFSVEQLTGLPVDAVNVHVMGLRISNMD